jgi:hypothetical protein
VGTMHPMTMQSTQQTQKSPLVPPNSLPIHYAHRGPIPPSSNDSPSYNSDWQQIMLSPIADHELPRTPLSQPLSLKEQTEYPNQKLLHRLNPVSVIVHVCMLRMMLSSDQFNTAFYMTLYMYAYQHNVIILYTCTCTIV